MALQLEEIPDNNPIIELNDIIGSHIAQTIPNAPNYQIIYQQSGYQFVDNELSIIHHISQNSSSTQRDWYVTYYYPSGCYALIV